MGASQQDRAMYKVLNSVIRLPYSNPMCFRRRGDKRVWDDAEEREYQSCYLQRWSENDLLSFQFSWENYHIQSESKNFTVKFIVNGAIARTSTFSAVQNLTYSGHLYDEFVVRFRNDPYVNGIYVFSQRIKDITSGGRIITEGDEFYVEITDMRGDVWTSNRMLCTGNLEGTKLFHYKLDCGMNDCRFDTFWGYMVNGYDVRLEAGYTELEPASDITLFDTYTGGKEIIRSLPKECVTLNLGDNARRIPRDFFRLLNVFFCCDEKTIDGVDVEVSEGIFDIERETGVFNDKYTVQMVLRRNRHSYSTEAENEIVELIIGGFSGGDNDGASRTEVLVNSSDRWTLDINSVMNDAEFSKLTGGNGSDTIEIVFKPNTSGEDITYNIPLKNENGETIATIQAVNKAVSPSGLGYMAIGDTFRI